MMVMSILENLSSTSDYYTYKNHPYHVGSIFSVGNSRERNREELTEIERQRDKQR